MTQKVNSILSVSFFLLMNSLAFGSQAGETEPKHPMTFFAGFGTGYATVSGNEYSEAPSGPHLILNTALAFEFNKWQLDVGVGWIYSSISGKNSNQLPISVSTRAGMFDLGAFYKLGERWQLGPAVNLVYGTDTGFGSRITDGKTSLLVGVQTAYTIWNPKFPLRLWSQLSTDTNMASRRFLAASIGLQIGLPIGSSKTSPSVAKSDEVRSTSFVRTREVRVVLDPKKVFFQTSSAALKPNVRRILQEVGGYLEQDPSTSVVISGHADQRGRYEYNLKLSKKRAESVRYALLPHGVESDRFEINAFSYSKLIDPRNVQTAWAKNRRVELSFQNVKDPEKLIEMLRPLTYENPENGKVNK